MKKKKTKSKDDLKIDQIHQKLDAIIAVLLRQLNDEYLGKWNNQEKFNMVKMLIDMDFDNPNIAKVTGLAYGSVANIRSKIKKGKSK